MLSDIVNYMENNTVKLDMIINDNITNYLTPISQILFISPININVNIEEQINFINYKNKNKLVQFIKDNKKYYYNLDTIFNDISNYIDCSASIFLSKCHLHFLENDVDIKQFINNYNNI